ncbi:rap1 GTPase-GDP dissociation stimulator 1-like isoform X2 [Corticium candelabrum]|uniref:rap1 GTPase-GDP dissociation stimulator 1-like isoform X2 n=1 Tax=Corticium candelabrum TaxID=121492 RepID=UPI002E263A7A|nr:rap1 GTPase-GDP dissociation stimulator 1-like isoform X2 [Corticium candelabrum]
MQGYIVLGPVCSMSEFVASLSLNQDDVTLSKAADSALEFCKEEDGNEQLVAAGVFSQCETLLAADRHCEGKIAQLIAELAKHEDNRIVGGQSGAIQWLVDGLVSSNRNVVCQSLRAVANLCIDCDVSRNFVLKANGPEKLHNCLHSVLHRDSHDDELLRLLAGTSLNLATEHKDAALALMSAGVVKQLVCILSISKVDETVHEMALSALDNILESGECPSCLVDSAIVEILKTTLNVSCMSLQSRIIDILVITAEKDDGKEMLVEKEVCDCVLDLIKLRCDEQTEGAISDEGMAIAYKAADLINLILTGDESMNMLFNDGHSRVVAAATHWLTLPYKKLVAAGALAIGNCARNDKNCQHLFDVGVVRQLVSLVTHISIKQANEEDINQHHVSIAVLSTLRNFSIPTCLKSQMVSYGVVDVATKAIASNNPNVQFKSLGILRLLVDGQSDVAFHIAETEGVITQIVKLHTSEGHRGVKAESARLVAALTKHCHSSKRTSNNMCHAES